MNILSLFKKRKNPQPIFSTADRFEVILSGSGGQGIILAGKILAEAAAIHDGKEAVMSQSYGPEARGGASHTEVIISSAKINYPKVTHTDALLSMTQDALDKYGGLLDEAGLLIVDETFISQIPAQKKNVFKAPFTSLSMKILKAPIVANIIALGALSALTKVVSREALIRAVLENVPEKVIGLDRMAVDLGFKVVRESGFQWRSR